ncbi:NAD(P)-dependent oxidoreductase [Paenibacillus sp. J5C_2022]|uniref:NAD(P)-dependent oxidoreductase n=1 Tax=Paenibacillus sp. J5C2022 TaxID=2977129 RepID=UPI0021CED251|nr:NAD(P)-dependent oxidoreductase [Paenibacillus sp. J5C2022]MCU6707196.1 NAD(P)-dependent oxidoreductase [Paenibacillus sp. J5C2022]
MMFSPDQTTIGFIGIGVMGTSMATHLHHAGYEVHLYTRTKAKAQPLLEKGMHWADSPSELAKQCQCIVTIVGYPRDVEEVYLGEDGLLNHASPGCVLIDMTTSSPLLAKRIYKAAAEKGMHALDAPVSGGDVGARNAALSIMVGGDAEAFRQAEPILRLMGSNIIRQGEAGAGQHTKMVNQIAIASNMIGVCEALVYAKSAGLDPASVLKSIETGAAGSWSLQHLAPRIIAGRFEPGFFVKHFIKDMGIALQSAEEMAIRLPGLELARKLYGELADAGFGDEGTHALYKLWEMNK